MLVKQQYLFSKLKGFYSKKKGILFKILYILCYSTAIYVQKGQIYRGI
ncbi:Putative protein [Zobellia galactanivorans]|uniref:Uncharacterized protein n=1 Tax=Zobellia galactanivorans (strain DSM 12802 / CCUG 47099 / CIP 106680 / NCIMB 13871 / Dsij) TaxID=63186 RepID=G0L3E5_ZOBGA|nr:Putative protein [Zobellia galactanivorans]